MTTPAPRRSAGVVGVAGRRRARVDGPRRRQVVVRFSDGELEAVRSASRAAGVAVGAWIGQAAVEASTDAEQGGLVGLPSLLRLHADVAMVAAGSPATEPARVGALLDRLDEAVVDAVSRSGRRGARRSRS